MNLPARQSMNPDNHADPCENMKIESVIVDKIAFEGPNEADRGYTVRASYLKEPHGGDALIEILKDGKLLRHFLFPAYKIWNIAAHFSDIVDGEIEKSSKGYDMAAWDGVSGAVILTPNNPK